MTSETLWSRSTSWNQLSLGFPQLSPADGKNRTKGRSAARLVLRFCSRPGRNRRMDRPSRDDRWRPGRRSAGDALHTLVFEVEKLLPRQAAIQLGAGMCEADRPSHCRLRKRDRESRSPASRRLRTAGAGNCGLDKAVEVRRTTSTCATNSVASCRVKAVGLGPTPAMTICHRHRWRTPMAETFASETLLDTVAAARRLGVSESFFAKARMRASDRATASSAGASATRRPISITGSWPAAGLRPPSSRRSCALVKKPPSRA